jgi:hypothetical protein
VPLPRWPACQCEAGRGSCALTAKQLRAGNYTVMASYGADRNFTASASGKITLTVLE